MSPPGVAAAGRPPGGGTAADRLAEARRKIPDEALRLAYHAALPVAIDVGLLNLLRVNFFLDMPFETEAALLLSPLFGEIGNGLYEMAPEVRNVLLVGLQTDYGSERVRQVALLLEQYSTPAWSSQPELEKAQQLTALSFVDPVRAAQWLETAGGDPAAGTADREWFIAMRRRLAAQPQAGSAPQEIARAAGRLRDALREVRLSAVRLLSALAQLPDTDITPAADALVELVRRYRGAASAPDVAAASALLRTLGGRYAESAGLEPRLEASSRAGPGVAPQEETVLAKPHAPVFFLSGAPHAGGASEGDLERRFFNDLSEDVAALVSRPVGSDPGFMDLALRSGVTWRSELFQAIGTSQVFVALLSPRYMASSWCGTEWAAFSRRRVVGVSAGEPAPGATGIIPVLWTPVRAKEIPAAIAGIRTFQLGDSDADVDARYKRDGIYGLLRTGREPDYQLIVWRLAQAIAHFVNRYRVEPVTISADSLHPVFGERDS